MSTCPSIVWTLWNSLQMGSLFVAFVKSISVAFQPSWMWVSFPHVFSVHLKCAYCLESRLGWGHESRIWRWLTCVWLSDKKRHWEKHLWRYWQCISCQMKFPLLNIFWCQTKVRTLHDHFQLYQYWQKLFHHIRGTQPYVHLCKKNDHFTMHLCDLCRFHVVWQVIPGHPSICQPVGSPGLPARHLALSPPASLLASNAYVSPAALIWPSREGPGQVETSWRLPNKMPLASLESFDDSFDDSLRINNLKRSLSFESTNLFSPSLLCKGRSSLRTSIQDSTAQLLWTIYDRGSELLIPTSVEKKNGSN